MVSLTGTLTAVGVLTAGLWAVCASVFATAGWTAPACLGAGFGSGVLLILGIVNDATSQTSSSGNNPDSRSLHTAAVRWFKVHDNGDMEAFDGRLRELYGTNETITMHDAKRGYSHKVWMEGSTAKVKTDLTQGGALTTSRSSRQAESQFSKMSRRSRKLAGMAKRETSSESANALSSATYSAQNIAGDVGGDSSANADAIGDDIANTAIHLGTWCTSIISSGGTTVADMGLTLGGKDYVPSDDEPPCQASSKRKARF